MNFISFDHMLLGSKLLQITHFRRFVTQKLTKFETRFWTRDTCHMTLVLNSDLKLKKGLDICDPGKRQS